MRPRLIAGLLCLAAPLWGPASASALSDGELSRALAAELRTAGPASGAYVRDLDSGAELFALRATTARIPASVEKLYPTAAAMLVHGAAGTLETTVESAAAVDAGGVLDGDLVLVGGGDPFFGDESAARLARAVRAAGIRRVAGSVVGDESAFDRRRAGCCRGYDGDLGGVLSALAYDRGIFAGRAQLDAAGFAATRFAAQLRAAGVRTASARGRAGTAPDDARPIATVRSRSFAELARFVNVPSNNFAAEMLLKALGSRSGATGTLTSGTSAVRGALAAIGVRPRKLVDGSGLSRANRSSPREVVDLLAQMNRRAALAEPFRSSLALAGRTGTVKRRMRATRAAANCRVKTGTLRSVSALAGYCRGRGGRDIGFALMFNRMNTFAAKAIEDRVAAAIADLEGAPAPVTTPPAPLTPPASGGAGPAAGR